ncbi:MAG TPA: hypothetical protein VH349_07030 [Ktedonobacterales bacterium]|jgi:hypothetical protein
MDDSDANLTDEPGAADGFEVLPLDRSIGGAPLRAAPPGARLSRLRRTLAGSVAVASILLAIALLVASIPSAGASIRQALNLPTPILTAAPPRGSDTLLLAHTVPWGRLSVDGRSLDGMHTFIDRIDGYPAIRLPSGAHTITYAADHFPNVTCMVTIPFTTTRTAPTNFHACGALPFPSNHPPASAPAAHLIDLRATLDRLAPATLAQLKEEIDTALPSAQTVVQPGERYLGPDGAIHVASAPLPAQLVMRLNNDPLRLLPLGDFPTMCAVLCADPIQSATPTQSPVWSLFANVTSAWRFGDPERAVTAPLAAPADVSADVVTQLVTAGVTYDQGRLRVEPRGAESASRLVFAAATNAVSGFGKKLTAQYPAGWSALPYIAHNPADGCMIVVGTIQVSGDGFPGGKTLRVLYQFGVLLAADQMAHDVLPELPVASASDLARWRAVS